MKPTKRSINQKRNGGQVNCAGYTKIILGASGITEAQAKTCFYYAITTYLLERRNDPREPIEREGGISLDHMPILAIIGPHGTGKTDLLKQLEKMVWQPKLIGALSTAELRDELDKTGTALIDEADNIHEAHLIRRYSVETANVSWKESLGDRKWQRHDANIFGATILARRTPFKDTATKSRAIIIATKYRPGSYKSTEVDGRDIMKLAKEVKLTVVSSQRVRDNWSPLQSVAECLGDKAWLEYAEEQIGRDTRALVAAQKVEPEEAILRVLLEEMTMVKLASGLEVDVVLSTIKKKLDGEFDVKLNIPQIQDLLASFGFRLVKPKGYPKVKGNVALVKKLMVERTSPG